MDVKYILHRVFSHPLGTALAIVIIHSKRILKAYYFQLLDRHRLSYEPKRFEKCKNYLDGLKIKENVTDAKIFDHKFNLLGSGWTQVSCLPDISNITPGNRYRAQEIRSRIDASYLPIDWQLDFKSGFRWREKSQSKTLRYGHKPGVDIKVPWELARMQHLPRLAFGDLQRGYREFQNQVLDFSAANPPGYGVNWFSSMDVAIRVANILIAYDLLVSRGCKFDGYFLGEFGALITAHGKHIMSNLDWRDDFRGNHYLANICGLLFVSIYLPTSEQTEEWFSFAIKELVREVNLQFSSDGANFEASTSYHRLSVEMVVYATALVLGRGKAKAFPTWYFERLELMAEFIMHITKPNGCIVQIGDNDSGRFFKFNNSKDLDHRCTVGAINSFFDRSDLSAFAGEAGVFESRLVGSLAGGYRTTSYLSLRGVLQAEGKIVKGKISESLNVVSDIKIELNDTSFFADLKTYAYPDFGLYIWRSSGFFLSVRCGPVGQNGNGGHAHNDQLAIELHIGGEDWIADPGTYLYTSSPEERNAYRSVHAHSAPKIGAEEPARLDLGLFRLEDNCKARCLVFNKAEFEGMHFGYGFALHRNIKFDATSIRIKDLVPSSDKPNAQLVVINNANALRKLWKINLPFSPSYGIRN